jgi:prepilin-type N-terminal cleavage/methylation domain-containing protein
MKTANRVAAVAPPPRLALVFTTLNGQAFGLANQRKASPKGADEGFSLLELLVATAVFTVVSAAAFSLFNKQQTSALNGNEQVGLNVALRNATAQLQMDLVNGGTGYRQAANIPAWPVGVSIVNNVVASGATCYNSATLTYTASCFDQINVIAAANPTTYPPVNATDSTGGTSGTANCSNTSTGIAYGQAASGWTLTNTAAEFKSGDQLLFLKNNGKLYSSVVLTQNAQVAGNAVKFSFNATSSNGSNSAANDPLSITTDPTDTANDLTNSFCGNDWVLKLAPISFQVNSSNAGDPQLTRTQSGSTAIVMDQVIGFKIGATIINESTDILSTTYNYNAATYTNNTANDEAYNFTLIRSVRISLIGRTAPSSNPAYSFRNSFDGGPYQVQGSALVVNPRNMSMND